MAPGPAGHGADGTADQEGPGDLQHPERGHALGVAETADRGEEQDGRAVRHARQPEPHAGQITLRGMSTSPEPTPPATSETEVVPPRRASHVFGIETEYGISALAPGSPALVGAHSTGYVDDDLHPMQLSNHVVKAYGSSVAGQPAGWDYETETPLRDIRGYEISRAAAHPDQLTDSDLGMANVILTNGARLYVDHAHPEYSGPEVTSALDAVRYDKAGDAVMAIAAQRATQSLGRSVRLYKNNTDGKGASYGTHENYLLQRSTPFDRVVTQFTAYLVTRQVISGAGRVGIGQASQQPGFQISQRADFFEAEVGLETTLNRPIINTRDEPHADASRHRRLHVITGDANLSEIATYLKVGSAAWVLRVIEAGELGTDLRLDTPVSAMRAVSHDLSCAEPVQLADGRSLTPVDVQEAYLDACRQHYERVAGDLSEAARIEAKDLFTRWQDCLDALRSDIFSLADQLDWVAKLKLMESYRAARRPELGGAQAGPDRPAVRRCRPPAQPLPGPGGQGQDAPAGHRRRDRARPDLPAGGHPGVLPGQGDGEVRVQRGRRVVGLGDLRRARPSGPAADPAARPAARDPRAGRPDDRRVQHRDRPLRGPGSIAGKLLRRGWLWPTVAPP